MSDDKKFIEVSEAIAKEFYNSLEKISDEYKDYPSHIIISSYAHVLRSLLYTTFTSIIHQVDKSEKSLAIYGIFSVLDDIKENIKNSVEN